MVNEDENNSTYKQAEKALQEERNRLRSIVDVIQDGLTVQDKDYNIIYQNEFLKKTFGGLGKKCYQVYEGQNKVCSGCPVQLAWQDGRSHKSERRVTMPTGEITFWEMTANPIRDARGEITSCLEIMRNITERKNLEEELQSHRDQFEYLAKNRLAVPRENQEYYRALLENPIVGIAVLDTNYRIIMVNSMFAQNFKKHASEFVGKYCFREFEKRETVCPHCPGARAMGSRKSEEVETQGVRDDGTRFWVRNRAVPLFGSDGMLKGFIEMVENIDERKKAEQHLKESEQRLKDITYSMADWIWEVDERGVYNYCSEKVKDVLGYESAEIIGKTPFDLMPSEEAKSVEEVFLNIFKNKQNIKDIENWNLTKDGRRICLLSNAVPILDEKGNLKGYRGVDRDITERKRMEKELQKAKDELIAQQSKMLLELSTPVIQVWDEILVLPLIGPIDTIRAQQIIEQLLTSISSARAVVAIIDITGVHTVDTNVANYLLKTIHASRMLGCECVLTGVSPDNAQTLTKLGVDLASIMTKGSLETGLRLAFERTKNKVIKE
jgi:PAS domain S-box-containing protein